MSDMYICRDCHRLYQEDELPIVREMHGFDYGPAEERIDTCRCGGDLTPAVECSECGIYIPEDEACLSDEKDWPYLCAKCKEEEENALYLSDILASQRESVA